MKFLQKKVLLILFLLFSSLFSQEITSKEELKISALALDPTCDKFWEKNWTSIYIVKYSPDFFKKFFKNEDDYLPEMAITLASSNIFLWNAEPDQDFKIKTQLTNFEKEKTQLLNSRKYAYEANLSFNKLRELQSFFERISVLKTFFSLLIKPDVLLEFVVDNKFNAQSFSKLYTSFTYLTMPSFFLFDLVDSILLMPIEGQYLSYLTSYWKETMNGFSNSLTNCGRATNSIFLEAEKKAIRLYDQGIDQEGYYGSAKEAYNQWKIFVKGAKHYSNPNTKISEDAHASPSSLYGLVYKSATNIKRSCDYPSHLVVFKYPTPDLFFNYACTLQDNSLLSYALEMNKKLEDAYSILENEYLATKKFSQELNLNYSTKKKDLDYNNPDAFFTDEIFQTQITTVKVSPVSGSMQELYSSINQYSLLANNYFAQAQKTSKFVGAIFLYKNASQNYLKAIEATDQMKLLMEQKTETACSYAKRELSLFSNKIETSYKSDKAKLAQALITYKDANSFFEKAQNSNRLGEKFIACKKAYLALINFPADFNKTQNLALAKSLLKTYLEYIQSGEKMGADVSSYKKDYQEFDALLKQNYPVDILDIESNIKSIKNYLNSFMVEETELYNKILSILSKTLISDESFYLSFSSKIKQYRDQEGWNLVAFKNKNSLTSFLKSSLDQLNKNLIKYVQSQLCKNAKFYFSELKLLEVNEPTVLSGTWQTVNPLDVDFTNGLDLSCQISIPFSNNAIKSRSNNIENVILSQNSIKLFLNSLEALEPIFVNFSEEKKPFVVSEQNCLLSITKENNIMLSSNYTIKSLYDLDAVLLSIPWDTSLDKIDAKLFGQQGSYTGKLTLNQKSEAKVDFIIPLKKDTNKFSSFISSNLKRNFQLSQESMSIANNYSFFYTYKLNLGKLPNCSNILIQQEEKFKDIKNLKINAIGGQVKSTKTYPSSLSTTWETNIVRSSSSNLELLISFNFVDAKEWFNTNSNNLYSKAIELNDDHSLQLLEKAKNAFSISDYGTAAKLLNQVKSRLNSLEINREQYQIFSEKIKNSQGLLENLSSISVSDPKKKTKLNSFISFLKSSIEKANSLSKSDIEKASQNLDKDLNKLNLDIEKEIGSLYPKLEKKTDELILLYSKANLDLQDLTNASDLLIKSKELLLENKPIEALSKIYMAADLVEKIEKNFSENFNAIFDDLKNKKMKLEQNIRFLIEELEKYSTAAKSLETSKMLFKPPLSSTEAKNIQKPLNSAFKTWAEPQSNFSIAKLSQIVSKNQEVLTRANATYSSTEQKYLQAKVSLQTKASSLLTKAKNILNSLENKNKQEELAKEINKVEELIGKEEYIPAILLADKLIKNYSEQNSSVEVGGTLPIFEIFVSVIFVAAIAYILLKPKNKPKQQETKESKTLKKANEN